MKYKVGDKVRVKSLEWYNENKDEFGDVKTPNNIFVPDMSIFCGQECIICQVLEDASCNKTYYGLKEDVSGFSWTDDMFEGLVESELNKPRDNEQSFKAVDDVDYVKPVVFENIVRKNNRTKNRRIKRTKKAYNTMITTGTIIYPEEYWMNSQLAIARFFGGCTINGKEYVIVNKEGVNMQKLADKAKIGDVLIPKGEPADLILKEWQPIYRALGRYGLFEFLSTQSCDLKYARKYVKQLKSKEK